MSLLEEYLRPLGLSQNRLAVAIGVRLWRINGIIRGKRSMAAAAALRLSRHFATSDRFWPNLQARYDLEIAEGRSRRGSRADPAALNRRSGHQDALGVPEVGRCLLCRVERAPKARLAGPERWRSS
ncbi:MAG: HigA family addiction module antitoxin [Propionicimonas sp.]|nr:HigA family addiction module antitoxin [Propionicimonas sp.]